MIFTYAFSISRLLPFSASILFTDQLAGEWCISMLAICCFFSPLMPSPDSLHIMTAFWFQGLKRLCVGFSFYDTTTCSDSWDKTVDGDIEQVDFRWLEYCGADRLCVTGDTCWLRDVV